MLKNTTIHSKKYIDTTGELTYDILNLSTQEGLRTVILLSGSGSTAEAIVKATRDEGILNGEINVVGAIASNEEAGGIERLRKLGIEVAIFDRKSLGKERFRAGVRDKLREFAPKITSQNGWTPRTSEEIVEEFSSDERIIINQHPGPLALGLVDAQGNNLDFGGKGMHGKAPTAAVLAYHWLNDTPDPTTESTVHLVTPFYDDGAIIRRAEMAVPMLGDVPTINDFAIDSDLIFHLKNQTDQTQVKLLGLEHANVIAALREIAEHGAHPVQRERAFITEGTEHLLFAAKGIAINLYPNG